MLDDYIKSSQIEELKKVITDEKSVLIEELWNSPKAAIAALAQDLTKKNVLIISGQSTEEMRLFHDFALFTQSKVIDFPAWETLPSEQIAPSPDIVGERYQVLREIENEPAIILSSLQACLQKLIPIQEFKHLNLLIQIGTALNFEAFQQKLSEMGYIKSGIASDKGQYAVRGGIIDVYPVSSPDPFRIEFFGDEVASIRIYDPIGQRSIKPVEKIDLTPALELEMLQSRSELATLFDYLGPNTIVILDDVLALEDRWATLKSTLGQETKSFMGLDELFKIIEPLQKIFVTDQPIDELSEIKMLDRSQRYYSETIIPIEFEAFGRSFQADRFRHPFVPVTEFLFHEEGGSNQELLSKIGQLKDFNVHFLTQSDAEKENLIRQLEGHHLNVHTHFENGYLSNGFVLPEERRLVLPFTELTQRYKIRRQKHRSTYHVPTSEMFDLTPGEMVVHFHNGIGKYLGIEKKTTIDGNQFEHFIIEYADQAKLFVPLNQAHLISKYVGSTDDEPERHKLGSNKWKIQKEKTQKALVNYASDLLKVYAHREIKGGFAFKEDSHETKSFEDEFPFSETEDQLSAISAIRQDMMSSKAMDRLVCGDVGYGKTEVAMRAAFKAVLDGGKQVAVLVPTTVLAMQHYENFVARMSNFPVRIGVMSRFRTAKEIRLTLKQVEEGSIDILIGTHRIISEDVKFKDLGLIIIDEEQRFGVKAKEHLKRLKTGVDCLTLSATPIPRTLYMSLMGARDMSVIATPPQDRLPIKTIIADPIDQTIKTALLRELARDGQAYFIHNRVDTIFSVADKLKTLLPQARIVVGHGQMSSGEIDEVFHAFKSGRADILVATTIVENGIDIPNANTILIDRADTFGLADLYQLRGRVGRWNRRAYAYFLVKSTRSMSELSRKRLNALAESSGYGGGMKVAMRDLEIRGAGDILGYEQSGHVSSIGFHLYCKLLKRTIQTLQGKLPSVISDTKIDMPIDARLPERYIPEISIRMEIYQRLGEALSTAEIDTIFAELKDRFGKLPREVEWLNRFTRIRVFASLNGFNLLKIERNILIAEQQKGDGVVIKKALFKIPSNPEEFEKKLLEVLKKEFRITKLL